MKKYIHLLRSTRTEQFHKNTSLKFDKNLKHAKNSPRLTFPDI